MQVLLITSDRSSYFRWLPANLIASSLIQSFSFISIKKNLPACDLVCIPVIRAINIPGIVQQISSAAYFWIWKFSETISINLFLAQFFFFSSYFQFHTVTLRSDCPLSKLLKACKLNVNEWRRDSNGTSLEHYRKLSKQFKFRPNVISHHTANTQNVNILSPTFEIDKESYRSFEPKVFDHFHFLALSRKTGKMRPLQVSITTFIL